jgi:butyrate kinase
MAMALWRGSDAGPSTLEVQNARSRFARLSGVILYVINPGSTDTKLALARVEAAENAPLPGQPGLTQLSLSLERREFSHPDLSGPPEVQLAQVRAALEGAFAGWPAPDAVVARGGLIGPLAAGAYRVTPELAAHSLAAPFGWHASNLGATLALEQATALGVPAYLVDPISVDELLPEARVSGLPGTVRASRFHALNARMVARRAAHEVGKRLAQAGVVVAHLGAGVSVTAFHGGRAIDTSGSYLAEGPFSAQRAGGLPLSGMLDLAYSGVPRAELERRLTQEGGFRGLTGSADLRELERREKQEPAVRLAAEAFVHQVCKSIGAYSAALPGRPDAIAITGGVARWAGLIDRIERRVSWIAPIIVLPGELETEALAEGAGRVLLGIEPARDWAPPGGAS